MRELPEGWTEAALEDIATVILGQSPPGDSYNDSGKGSPFFQGKAEFGEMYPTVAKWTTEPKRIAKQGDILISVRAPVGPTNIATCECAIGRGLNAISPGEGVDRDYLLWAIRSSVGSLAEKATGTTFAAVTGQHVKGHVIYLAPTSEQRRIVEAIEEHFTRIEAADKSLRSCLMKLQVLRKAAITEVLLTANSPSATWSSVGRTLSGKTFPSGAYTEEGIKLLRPGNLDRSGEVVWSPGATRHLPVSFARDSPKYLLEGTHLLMNLTAQSLADDFLGRVCLSSSDDCFLLNQRIAKLSSDAALDEYLFWVFRSNIFRAFVSHLNTGSLIEHISTKQLDTFSFPLPSERLQRALVAEIGRRVAVIDRIESSVAASMRKAEMSFRSTLCSAFAGQLVPQDANDEPAAVIVERIRHERSLTGSAGPKSRRRVAS